MRQPDGRPRGFGYVTLDSAEAAARALAEPQVIDERIVDTKLAVPDAGGRPEGSVVCTRPPLEEQRPLPPPPLMARPPLSSLWCSAAGQRGGLALPDIGAPFVDSAWPWGEALDCMHLLGGPAPFVAHVADVPPAGNRSMPPAPIDCVDLLTRRRPRDTAPAPGAPPPGWLQATLAPTLPAATSRGPTQSVASKQPTKAPLGELTDFMGARDNIENRTGAKDEKKQAFDFIRCDAPRPIGVSDVGAPRPGGLFSQQQAPTSFGTRPTRSLLGAISAAEEPLAIYEDAWDAPESPSPKPAALVVQTELPSAGSALHSSGECRRCNFFAKGRCRNGKDCSFCHLDHDKRKPSRQERRESGGDFSDSDSSASAPTPTQVAVCGPPGLSLPKAAPPGLILPEEDQPDANGSPTVAGRARPEMCTMGTQTADYLCPKCG